MINSSLRTAAPSSRFIESKVDMDHRIAHRTLAVALFFVIAFFSSPLLGHTQSATDVTRNTPDWDRSDVNASDLSTSENQGPNAVAPDSNSLPDAPQAAQTATPARGTPAPSDSSLNTGQQTKRILFIIPNFRAVSVDEKLPPLTAKEEIKLVLQDSFDYSSFIYVGIVAGIGQAENSYPQFGQGADGYGRYYWHSMADAVGENTFTEFIVPYLTREDPRYYTLGRGGFPKRLVYSVSRLAITRNNDAKNTFNFGEIVGAGASSGISNLYYPSVYTTWTKTGQKWLLQVAVDGLGDIAKEFWPDVNAYVFKNKF
jgi:hypothetical protein